MPRESGVHRGSLYSLSPQARTLMWPCLPRSRLRTASFPQRKRYAASHPLSITLELSFERMVYIAQGSGAPALSRRGAWVARPRLLRRNLHAGAGNTYTDVLVSAHRRHSTDTGVRVRQKKTISTVRCLFPCPRHPGTVNHLLRGWLIVLIRAVFH